MRRSPSGRDVARPGGWWAPVGSTSGVFEVVSLAPPQPRLLGKQEICCSWLPVPLD